MVQVIEKLSPKGDILGKEREVSTDRGGWRGEEGWMEGWRERRERKG